MHNDLIEEENSNPLKNESSVYIYIYIESTNLP